MDDDEHRVPITWPYMASTKYRTCFLTWSTLLQSPQRTSQEACLPTVRIEDLSFRPLPFAPRRLTLVAGRRLTKLSPMLDLPRPMALLSKAWLYVCRWKRHETSWGSFQGSPAV